MQPLSQPNGRGAGASKAILAAAIVVLGALPILIYCFTLGVVPTLTPDAAQAKLAAASAVALVDVRRPDEFAVQHVPCAHNLPYAQIAVLNAAAELPPALRDKTLLLLCNSGLLSALATHKLTQLHVQAFNVEGGMQKWIAASLPRVSGANGAVRPPDQEAGAGQALFIPGAFRVSPWYEQLAATLSGFAFKPVYMLLSLILAYALRKRRELDLAALRWALLFFFAGEFFCYANFFAYRDDSYLFEYLHSYGMVLAFAFGTFAFFEGVDTRVIFLSDERHKCAALSLCKQCIKYNETFCRLRRVFQVMIPACIIMALLPFGAAPSAVSYNTVIGQLPYNYSHPVLHQLYEIWFCPALAIALFSGSWLILCFKKNAALLHAKIYFCAGLGFFMFGYLRLIFLAAFRDNLVWFGFWEEVTEFLGIAAVAIVLWIFRQGLFTKDAPVKP